MASNLTTQAVIASALALPPEQRLTVLGALHSSLTDSDVDHGPEEDPLVVSQAWSKEIAARCSELKEGRVKTISAAEAERLIFDDE
ncbi:MAG: addiction module protein [Planctomycetota bacterium]